MESGLESHGPRESLELSIVQIGLEATELQRTKGKSILWLGRRLFHPVLIAPLPRWPISKDCIVVFKRTKVCPIVFEKDPDDPDDQDDDDDDDDDEQDYWADIPHDECLMLECAAPCAQHLLARPARRAGR